VEGPPFLSQSLKKALLTTHCLDGRACLLCTSAVQGLPYGGNGVEVITDAHPPPKKNGNSLPLLMEAIYLKRVERFSFL